MKTTTGKSACATGIRMLALEIVPQIVLDNILYICRL
jgi:hypothetical protein